MTERNEVLEARGWYLPKRMKLPEYNEDTMPSDYAAVADLLDAIVEAILHPNGNPATLLARATWMSNRIRGKAELDAELKRQWADKVHITREALREELS